MADDVENDDNWLYGENNDNVIKETEKESSPEREEPLEEAPISATLVRITKSVFQHNL